MSFRLDHNRMQTPYTIKVYSDGVVCLHPCLKSVSPPVSPRWWRSSTARLVSAGASSTSTSFCTGTSACSRSTAWTRCWICCCTTGGTAAGRWPPPSAGTPTYSRPSPVRTDTLCGVGPGHQITGYADGIEKIVIRIVIREYKMIFGI